MPARAALLASPEADQHLDNPGELVLRSRRIGEREVAEHAKDVDGGGAFHRDTRSEGPVRWTRTRSGLVQQALCYREEVETITSGSSATAFGQVQAGRGCGALELIAE